jgi:hypothetical protein
MPSPPHKKLFAACLCACLLVLALAGTASAAKPPVSGGAGFAPPPAPPKKATIVAGKAIAPANAPARVRRVIDAGNRLIGKPYRYGGGHQPFSSRLDTGYDCSGTASFALYGGRFLRSPMPSGSFVNWGERGPGTWITSYANAGHMYIVVAGLRLDTGMRDDPSTTGPGWSKRLRPVEGYAVRHPRGF